MPTFVQFKKITDNTWEFQYRIKDHGVARMMQWVMENYKLNFQGKELLISTNHILNDHIVLSDSRYTQTNLFVKFEHQENTVTPGESYWVMTCCDEIYNLLVNQPIDNMKHATNSPGW